MINIKVLATSAVMLISVSNLAQASGQDCDPNAFKDKVGYQSSYEAKLLYLLSISEQEFAKKEVKDKLELLFPKVPITADFNNAQSWARDRAGEIKLKYNASQDIGITISQWSAYGIKAYSMCGNALGLNAFIDEVQGDGARIAIRYNSERQYGQVRITAKGKTDQYVIPTRKFVYEFVERDPKEGTWVRIQAIGIDPGGITPAPAISNNDLPTIGGSSDADAIFIPPNIVYPEFVERLITPEPVVSHVSGPGNNNTVPPETKCYMAQPGDTIIDADITRTELQGSNGPSFRQPPRITNKTDSKVCWDAQVVSGTGGVSASALAYVTVKVRRKFNPL